VGNGAGRRNTKIRGSGRRSSGKHTGPPRQSRGGKRRVNLEKQELLRRLTIATRDDWLTPTALEILRSLRDQGPLGFPRFGERAEAFALLRTAGFVELYDTTPGARVRFYMLTAKGRERLVAEEGGAAQVGPAASA
jgi:hypothetical protein